MGAVNTRVAAALAGPAFLGFGLWAFLGVGTSPALRLAHIGVAGGVAMSLGLGPNLGSWNGVQGHVSTASTVLMFILLLRFFVTFPRPKPVSESRPARLGLHACDRRDSPYDGAGGEEAGAAGRDAGEHESSRGIS